MGYVESERIIRQRAWFHCLFLPSHATIFSRSNSQGCGLLKAISFVLSGPTSTTFSLPLPEVKWASRLDIYCLTCNSTSNCTIDLLYTSCISHLGYATCYNLPVTPPLLRPADNLKGNHPVQYNSLDDFHTYRRSNLLSPWKTFSGNAVNWFLCKYLSSFSKEIQQCLHIISAKSIRREGIYCLMHSLPKS